MGGRTVEWSSGASAKKVTKNGVLKKIDFEPNFALQHEKALVSFYKVQLEAYRGQPWKDKQNQFWEPTLRVVHRKVLNFGRLRLEIFNNPWKKFNEIRSSLFSPADNMLLSLPVIEKK